MRNQPQTLDRNDAMRTFALRDRLEVGKVVTLHYFKRDGSASHSCGEVVYHNGREGCDTLSVTINDVHKGHRTINLDKVVRFQIH